jgi:hypothetical protein
MTIPDITLREDKNHQAINWYIMEKTNKQNY